MMTVSHQSIAMRRARGALLRTVGLRYGVTITQFRVMSNDEIDSLPYVGASISARLQEIRDTWTDEQIADFTGVRLLRIPIAPAPPCLEPHGALSWLGG